MDALMIGLLGAALATIGGRWWTDAAAMSANGSSTAAFPVLASALIAASLSAIAGGWIAASVRGPGLLLLLALSLLAAGLGALWPRRGAVAAPATGPVGGTIILTAAQITEPAPFIILAVAAWSNNVLLSGLGGAAGMIAALTAAAVPPPRVGRVRVVAAAILSLAGAWCALRAFRLL